MSNNSILVLSFLASTLFLVLERALGIGIDFHPDSTTYLTVSSIRTATIFENPRYIVNHGYFLWASLLGESPVALVFANMVLYSFTNKMLYKSYAKYSRNSNHPKLAFGRTHYLIFGLLIFSLYRLHISVHILKDTMVIFLTVFLVTGATKLKFFWLLPITVVRIFGAMYFTLFLRGRNLYIFLFAVFVSAIVFQTKLIEVLLTFNSADMNFRQGTTIPSFQDMGIIGVVIRMIVWPLLMLSGFFVILAPSPLFIPIALGSFILQWWSLTTLKRPAITLGSFILLALLAALAPGFASYQRYCLPILTVLPLLMVFARYKPLNTLVNR